MEMRVSWKVWLARIIIIAVIVAAFIFTKYLPPFPFSEPPLVPESEISQSDIQYALKVIERGKYSHQYYINHPEMQTDRTGNTTWNIQKVADYDLFKKIVMAVK